MQSNVTVEELQRDIALLEEEAEKMAGEYASACAERDAALAGAVKVKPLEWHCKLDTTYKAEGVAGYYTVFPNIFGEWTLDDGMAVESHPNPWEAKKAGDAEEARRILSALEPDPAHDERLIRAALEAASTAVERLAVYSNSEKVRFAAKTTKAEAQQYIRAITPADVLAKTEGE